jgi:hypothetical protein
MKRMGNFCMPDFTVRSMGDNIGSLPVHLLGMNVLEMAK